MKIVKPVGVFQSVSFYLIPVGNALLMYAYTQSSGARFPFDYAIIAFLIINVIFFFVGVTDHYQFEYDENELIVTNSWNPLFYRMYRLKNLERVEFDYFNNVGRGIRIFYEDSKDVFVCASFDDRLKKMTDELNKLIKENKDRLIGLPEGVECRRVPEAGDSAETERGTTTTFLYKDVEGGKLLDLINPLVRDELGISLEQITGDSYEFSHTIGTWARGKYDGIIAPSARGTSDNKLR